MVMQRDISSNALARLQRLQDLYSQYFDVSIQIVDQEGLKDFTVISNSSPFCLENKLTAPDICLTFLDRMVSAQSERITVTTCPFGCLFAIVPLGRSLETGVHTPLRNSLIVTKMRSPELSTPPEEEDEVSAIFGNLAPSDSDEQEKFFSEVQLIASAFDLVISLMQEDPDAGGIATGTTGDASLASRLTKRELEIARLVSTGMTNQQIADQLFLSEHTVKLHISNILRKLELSNRTQLAIFGVQNL